MDKEEFINTRWGPEMDCRYKGKVHPITAVDFTENTIEIRIDNGYQWVDIDEIELVNIGE